MAQANLQPLIDQVNATDDVLDSAMLYINGVPALIKAAADAAVANGATAAELAPVFDLGTTMKTKADAVKAAIEANTTA